ncbi:hypothetical protein FS837_007766, partial [Tulasnella sp. UAMH 9824]
LWTGDLPYTLTPYMVIGQADVFDTLASLMSKRGMAYTAPLMKFTEAFNVTTPEPVALGLYPVAPTLLLVGCLYIYSLTTLIIFLLSSTSNNLVIVVPRELTRKREREKKNSALDLAQSWLTDPLPLVGSVFPGWDGRHVARSVKSNPLHQVYDSKWGLEKVGIGLHQGSKGEMIFGLAHQSHSLTRQYQQFSPTVKEGSAIEDKTSPQLSDLGLQSGGKLDEPSLSPARPQLDVRKTQRRCRLIGILPTLCVVGITGGTGTLILGWVCGFQDPVEKHGGFLSILRNGSFVITETSTSGELLFSQTQSETLRILLFSALASHVVSVASTLLVSLLAYRAATQWLRASENPDDVNVTPIHLRYISRSKRAKAPRFFKEALTSVTGIYLLTHVIGLVDLWLHSRARAVSVIRSIPFEAEASYGITYNEDKCGPFNKTALPCQKLIGPIEGVLWFAPDTLTMSSGSWYTVLDVNPYFKLEQIDGTTILVPGLAKNYQSQGFNFNTHGLRVHCENLKDRCERLAAPLTQYLVQDESPVTNCSKAGYPRIPYYTTGELSPQGLDTRNIKTFVLGIVGDEMGGMMYVK